MPGQPPPPHPMTVLGFLENVGSLGLHLAQVCDNLPLDELSEGDLDRLHRKATEAGISIEVGTNGLGPERLKRYLSLAVRLGSPILRMVVDRGDFKPTPDQIVRTVRAFLPELQRAGICLAIENHDRFTSETLAGIFDELNSPMVGLCLDTVNSFGSLEGPHAVVDRLARFTVSLHVKDFRIFRTSHKLGFTLEGTPAGAGQLDVPWLLGRLRAAGRDVNAILELWIPPENSSQATIAKEQDWIVQSVAYLRTLIPD
jgi:sugar phosphate isomerase/epimerase